MSASRSDYYAVEVKGTTHLDFTDDAVVLPILKWLNITGDIDGGRVDRDHERGVAAFLRRLFTRWSQASFRRWLSRADGRNERPRQRVTTCPGCGMGCADVGRSAGHDSRDSSRVNELSPPDTWHVYRFASSEATASTTHWPGDPSNEASSVWSIPSGGICVMRCARLPRPPELHVCRGAHARARHRRDDGDLQRRLFGAPEAAAVSKFRRARAHQAQLDGPQQPRRSRDPRRRCTSRTATRTARLPSIGMWSGRTARR